MRKRRRALALTALLLIAALGAGAWWYLTQRGPGDPPPFEEMARRALLAHSADPGSPSPRELSASLLARAEVSPQAPRDLAALAGHELRGSLAAGLAPQATHAELGLEAGASRLELIYHADAGGALLGYAGQWLSLEQPAALARLSAPDGPLSVLAGEREDVDSRLSELLRALAEAGVSAAAGRLEGDRWVYPLELNAGLAAQRIDLARPAVKRDALVPLLSAVRGTLAFDPWSDRLEELALRLGLDRAALRSIQLAGGSPELEGLERLELELKATPDGGPDASAFARPPQRKIVASERFERSLTFAVLSLLGGITEDADPEGKALKQKSSRGRGGEGARAGSRRSAS